MPKTKNSPPLAKLKNNNEKIFFYKNVVRADIFYRFFGSFNKERGEPACGRAANYGGFSSPPQAAKCVRTIFNIRSQQGKVKFASPASAGSATKS
jgi:hypothetical protein